MKNRFQRTLKHLSHRVIPPAVLKHQIAWRNWRRGEPEIRYLKNLVDPNRAAIDVGAYLGAYTYFLARLAPAVYAFEPQQSCYQFLSRAYTKPVYIYQCALSNHEGVVGMRNGGDAMPNQGASLITGQKTNQHTNSVGDSSNQNGNQNGDQNSESLVNVQVKRLDSFELNNIGFIKIDAEGEETNVLDGAEHTIAKNMPCLLIEIEQRHRQDDIYDVFSQIEALGYQGEYLLEGERHALQTFSVEHHQQARLAGDKNMPYINNFIFRVK
jgi:FkbM family methyltransferase